jgi:hypothetical protein
MTNKRKSVLWPVLLIGMLVLSAFALAATGKLRAKATAAKPATAQSLNPVGRNGKGYILRGRLSPKLIWHLKALGDRLEKPGKERLALSGESLVTSMLRMATCGSPDTRWSQS